MRKTNILVIVFLLSAIVITTGCTAKDQKNSPTQEETSDIKPISIQTEVDVQNNQNIQIEPEVNTIDKIEQKKEEIVKKNSEIEPDPVAELTPEPEAQPKIELKTEEPKIEQSKPTPKLELMQITSPAFINNGSIPSEYTCQGANINPQINIMDVPDETKSVALIMDDPDAPGGTWVHWVMWNINPKTTVINKDSVPDGAIQGNNSWPKAEYGGPCPPSGIHRYFFKLYALDTELSLTMGSNKTQVESAMNGHILKQANLIGKYTQD
ncbi:MAG: YbhB/YbcL family Raf kinase inhibitor-like protein [bacterium]